ncbi:STAS domain-containing protein [Streptomyces sp. PmtG]
MEWSQPSQNVRIAVSGGARVTIHVAGELDIATAPVLARALERAGDRQGRVGLDLSRVMFCGTAGVRLLMDFWHGGTPAGGDVVVERAHSAVVRALRACGEPEARLLAHSGARAPLSDTERAQRIDLLSGVLDAVFQITEAPLGNAQLHDPASGLLRIVAQRGFHRPFLTYFESVADRETACGVAADDREPVFVEEVASSPIFLGTPALDVLADADVGAVLSVPVTSLDGALIGVVSVHEHRATRWTAERRAALTRLCRASCLL